MAKIDFKDFDSFLKAYDELCELNKGKYTPQQVFDIMTAKGASIQGKKVADIEAFGDAYAQKINDVFNKHMQASSKNLLEFEKGYEAPTNNDVPASSEKETPSESKKGSDIKLNSFGSNKNDDTSNEKWESEFINAANEDGWEYMTGQEKLETLVKEYNEIINQAREYVHDKNSGYGLSGKGAEQFNKELKTYKDKLSTIENSKEFKQLMKDVAKDGTGKLFDNGIMNTNVNQTLKLIASGAGSKMFNNKDRLGNWLDSYKTSGINKVAGALNDTPGGIAKTITHIPGVGRIIGPAISAIAGEDAQDIAKKYLKGEYKNKDTKKESKDTKDTKKDTNTVKSKNTSDTKGVKDWKPNPSNWNPSDETPINGVEEDNYIYDKNGNPVGSKNLNIKKK